MTLAIYLQRKREEAGLTQLALAKRAGFSQATIGKIEANLTDAPGIDVILALARALRVPPENLLKAYQNIDPDENLKSETKDPDREISELARRLAELTQKQLESKQGKDR